MHQFKGLNAWRPSSGGTQIGHSLPFVRIEFGHLPQFIILIGEMIELFRKAFYGSTGHLYWDEGNSCPKAGLPDISCLQDGDSIRFSLNLYEAFA